MKTGNVYSYVLYWAIDFELEALYGPNVVVVVVAPPSLNDRIEFNRVALIDPVALNYNWYTRATESAHASFEKP